MFDCFEDDSETEAEENEKLTPSKAPPPPPKTPWPWTTIVPVLSIFFVFAIGAPVIATIFTQFAIKSSYDTKADRADAILDEASAYLVDYNASVFNRTGPVGERGAQGAQGVTGPVGDNVTGAVGPVGPKGITGNASLGTQGPRGPNGTKGATGDIGNTTVGPQGIQGINGSRGPPGAVGPRGADGDQGIRGINGTQGVQGEVGDSGFCAQTSCSAFYTNDSWSFGQSGGGGYVVALSNTTERLVRSSSGWVWVNGSVSSTAALRIVASTMQLGSAFKLHANGTLLGLPLLLSGSSVAIGGAPMGSLPFRLLECNGRARVSQSLRAAAVSNSGTITCVNASAATNITAGTTRFASVTVTSRFSPAANLSVTNLNVSQRIDTPVVSVAGALTISSFTANGTLNVTGTLTAPILTGVTTATLNTTRVNNTLTATTLSSPGLSIDSAALGNVYYKTGSLTVTSTTNVLSVASATYHSTRVQNIIVVHAHVNVTTGSPASNTTVQFRLPERHNATGPYGTVIARVPTKVCTTSFGTVGAANSDDMSMSAVCTSVTGTQTIQFGVSVAYARYV